MSLSSIVNRARVKICGITRLEDAISAANLGVDAIGLVFYAESTRFVKLSLAAEIAATVGPFVSVVGLFVNAPVHEVNEAITSVGLDILQFHGDEDEAYCSQFSKPYIKAIRMHHDLNINESISKYPSARGFLFDSWAEDKYGGTGKVFDWARLTSLKGRPIILAGGLNPDNARKAISALNPYALDVSGGVEESPGIKSSRLMEQFVNRCSVA